jgi:hypothetical protein
MTAKECEERAQECLRLMCSATPANRENLKRLAKTGLFSPTRPGFTKEKRRLHQLRSMLKAQHIQGASGTAVPFMC